MQASFLISAGRITIACVRWVGMTGEVMYVCVAWGKPRSLSPAPVSTLP